MKSSNIDSALKELSFDELIDVKGGQGESAWYWVSYVVGATVNAYYEAAKGPAIRPSTYR